MVCNKVSKFYTIDEKTFLKESYTEIVCDRCGKSEKITCTTVSPVDPHIARCMSMYGDIRMRYIGNPSSAPDWEKLITEELKEGITKITPTNIAPHKLDPSEWRTIHKVGDRDYHYCDKCKTTKFCI